ncbi:MAG TPA: sigma 54-interacting transcriptional regulator [Labilithrix sp.]|nr:sigma 54-interacting transcriptional regulator [Labilithrix sp.]
MLHTLVDVTQELSGTLEIQRGFQRALEILERTMGALRASIALLDDDVGEIAVETAVGFEVDPRTVRYRLGEGVTGRVVEAGKPIVVPRINGEPMYLARAGRLPPPGQDGSFVCVPIIIGERAVGALSVLVPYAQERNLQDTVNLLKIVAAMVAQRLRVHRLMEAEYQRLRDENAHLRLELRERYDYANIIGKSGPMRLVYEQISQVAGTATTVLIRGESGTGKELIAHAIHYNSSRAKEPFIRVSCAALPESLIESELFGHEKGAFTGAQSRKKGRFELAEGGTLFLDEIGELSLSTQVKLLRVLQEREFERLGGTETIKANVRLITATNKDFEKAIAAGTFREDLYYRLNVFSVFVPPLRERRPDIMLLSDHFVAKYAAEHRKSIKRVSTPAIDMLMGYHWPGNVRELENTIERAVVVCDGSVIHAHHMPPALQTAEASGTAITVSLGEAMGKYERSLIEDALKSARGNRAQAARLLQTTERILSYKATKHGIDVERYRT